MFQQFRHEVGLQPSWPAPSEHVAAFIAFLSLKGKAPSTITSYISAVAFFHKLKGWADPSQNFIVQKLREGCRRRNQQSDTRRPITLDLLDKICQVTGSIAKSNLEASLFRAAFVLAFFGFFRVGELTVASRQADCSQILGVGDVWFVGHDQPVMLVRLRYSKTDQQGNSVTLRFCPHTNAQICPVRSVTHYLTLRPPLGHCLFVHADGTPLTAYQFRHMLKKCLEILGVPTSGFSGHSFRIGAATSAALQGMSIPDIQSAGRWRSAAVNSYIRPDKV